MAVYRDPSLLADPAAGWKLVRRPGAPGLLRWFPRLLIVPHLVVGLGLLAISSFLVTATVAGTDSSGVVVSESLRPSTRPGSFDDLVDDDYVVGGRTFHGHDSRPRVPRPASADPLAAGQPVALRSLGVGPWRHAFLREHSPPIAFPLLLMALFWNAIMATLVASVWIAPLRARWLYRHGATSPGTVVAKRERRGRGVTYELSYTFSLPGGSHHEDTMRVSSKELYDSVDVGERVTVLHPAYRPGPSLIYDCGDYRWAGDPATR